MAKYLLLLVLCLSGCAMQGRRAEIGGMPAYDGVTDTYPGDAGPLAKAAADNLAEQYPPGSTSVSLAKVKTPFGNALEAALREKGFSVSSDGNGIAIGYTLDMFQGQTPPTCYLRVRTADGNSFGTVRVVGVATPLQAGNPASPVESKDLPQEQAVEDRPATTPVASSTPPQPHPERMMPVSGGRAALEAARGDATPVRSKATAARIAKRNRIQVADFCRWNSVAPESVLEVGRLVYLREPAAGAPAAVAKAEAVAQPVARTADRPAKPLASSQPATAPSPAPVQVSAPEGKPGAPASAPAPAKATVPAGNSAGTPPAVQAALAELTPPSAGAVEKVLPEVAAEPTSAKVLEWAVEPGGVKRQMEEWAVRAKYRLIWRSKRDYVLETPARFGGSYEEAVKDLFTGLQRGGHALRVTIYQGNNVVEVAED
ncbi:TcpQ domain-containing protein [Fundidesulfovibrio putealis]|uniref:TcpQ domain-containing protein n=1 Tax=Fundidesulfovibrio putealis TaxID=270496 RepID=UPI0003FBA9C6|nr:TcpQ domain-containing protein [Fundidesulfovibrio putealis]KAF0234905.1 MAG: hypothetical protein FD177_468 [Desulfovibrionaceae bacterium]